MLGWRGGGRRGGRGGRGCEAWRVVMLFVLTAVLPCSPVYQVASENPSCSVGALLRRQGDLNEAVLAFEICVQGSPSVKALRNLASAYIETGRLESARKTLAQIMRAGAPADQCSARLSLLELDISSKKPIWPDCIQILHDVDFLGKGCGEVYPAHEVALRRIRADALMLCNSGTQESTANQSVPSERRDVSRQVAKQVLEDAVAVLKPSSARSWKRLCHAFLMLQEAHKGPLPKNTEYAATREGDSEGFSTPASRCFDALVRLEGKDDPPWKCQISGAVALMAAADRRQGHTAARAVANASTLSSVEGYEKRAMESILSRVWKARAFVGGREMCRLLHRLPAAMPSALEGVMSIYTQRLVAAVCKEFTGSEGAGHAVLDASTVRSRFGLSAAVQIVGVSLRLDPTTGWGNLGLQLMHELRASGRYYPLMLHAPSARLLRECRRVLLSSTGNAYSSHTSRLVASMVLQQGSWAADVLGDETSQRTEAVASGRARASVSPTVVDFTVIHPAKRFFFGENETVWGSGNVALVFFEEASDVQPHRLERAARYDKVILGSKWALECVDAVSSNFSHLGLEGAHPHRAHYRRVLQGVRPELFGPPSTTRRIDEELVEGSYQADARAAGSDQHRFTRAGAFRIYSGGKLEKRKGQDLVLEVFRHFQRRHPHSQLVTAWYNGFLGSAREDEGRRSIKMSSPYCSDPSVEANGSVAVSDWAVENGIPRTNSWGDGAVVSASAGQALKADEIAALLRSCHAAIFLSRAEGGSNLMAMEALAAGLPVVISNNTGHRDIISDDWCFPVNNQRPVYRGGERASAAVLEGWGEADIEDAVHALENIYLNPDLARAKGIRAAKFMAGNLTWKHTGEAMMAILAEVSSEQAR